MPILNKFQLPPLVNPDDFEDFCHLLWKKVWNDPDAEKHGRRGQAQQGVDIYGRPNDGKDFYGVQCKNKTFQSKNPFLSDKEVRKEVQSALSFDPPLKKLIIATSSPPDAIAQREARLITKNHLEKGLFTVRIYFWNQILDLLEGYDEVRKEYFSWLDKEISALKEAGYLPTEEPELQKIIGQLKSKIVNKEFTDLKNIEKKIFDGEFWNKITDVWGGDRNYSNNHHIEYDYELDFIDLSNRTDEDQKSLGEFLSSRLPIKHQELILDEINLPTNNVLPILFYSKKNPIWGLDIPEGYRYFWVKILPEYIINKLGENNDDIIFEDVKIYLLFDNYYTRFHYTFVVKLQKSEKKETIFKDIVLHDVFEHKRWEPYWLRSWMNTHDFCQFKREIAEYPNEEIPKYKIDLFSKKDVGELEQLEKDEINKFQFLLRAYPVETELYGYQHFLNLYWLYRWRENEERAKELHELMVEHLERHYGKNFGKKFVHL